MSTQLWLRRLQPNPKAHFRIFCFHFAGGSASAYRTWPAAMNALRADVEVCAVQLPGRENRIKEAPFTKTIPLVSTLFNVLQAEFDRPFAFFGHSMGAIVAYELAQTLQRTGDSQLKHLFVSARRAPSVSERLPLLHQIAGDDAFLRGIQQRYNNLPELLLQDPELRALFVPLLRADFTLVETYQPSSLAPLGYPVTALGGDADPVANRGELEAWHALTKNRFALHLFPGGHFYLQDHTNKLVEKVAGAFG